LSDVVAVVAWWLALTGCGLAAWPWLVALRLRAPAHGYALARVVGLLLLTLAFWWLNLLGLAANDSAALWRIAAALGLVSAALWVWRWPDMREALRRDWRHILVTELLFAATFALYAFYKAHDPAIDHTEEPMDLAFLNAMLRSPRLPPRDPWLAGHAISYYYLGYLLVAVVARLTGVAAGVAYNLGLAQTLALAAVGASGVLESLQRMHREESTRWGWSSALGGLGILVVGNLEGWFEALRARGVGSSGFYEWLGVPGLAASPVTGTWLPQGTWWWRASRPFSDTNFLGKISTVIAEFPAFSFLLGDLHPHLMSLPLVTLALLLAVELYRLAGQGNALLLDRAGRGLALLAPLLLGALGFCNSWDLPTFLAVALAALWLGWWRAGQRTRRGALGAGLTSAYLLAASLLLYLPFYWTLSSQARGLGLAYYAKTPLRSYLLVFGVWLLPVCAEAVSIWREARVRLRRWVWLWLAMLALPWLGTLLLGGWGRTLLGLGTALARGPWLLLLLSALIAVYGLDLARRVASGGGQRALARLLILLALCLTYATEFVYLRDVFETRMNTVFKVYYQAWVLFGLGACGLLARRRTLPSAADAPAGEPLRSAAGRWGLVWRGVALALMALTLYYPAAAAWTRARANWQAPTLDGTAYLAEMDPDAYDALRWLEQNARPDDVLVEAPGDEYDASTSRLSAFTGVPTILGWPGHEAQWRGDEREIQARLPALERIYTSDDAAEVLTLLRRYDATLLYVGAREWQLYGLDAARLAWYETFLTPVYGEGLQRFYRLPDAP